MSDSNRTADEEVLVRKAKDMLGRIYHDLDDLLEQWQMEGMHQHELYPVLHTAVEELNMARIGFLPMAEDAK